MVQRSSSQAASSALSAQPKSPDMLEISDITKTFNPGTPNEVRALRNVSLRLEAGSFLIIIGTNGSGKSTLLNAVAGTFIADAGRISLAGQEITRWPEHRRAKFIGRVFQNPFSGTAPNLSIAENLAMASRRGRKRGLGWALNRRSREAFRDDKRIVPKRCKEFAQHLGLFGMLRHALHFSPKLLGHNRPLPMISEQLRIAKIVFDLLFDLRLRHYCAQWRFRAGILLGPNTITPVDFLNSSLVGYAVCESQSGNCRMGNCYWRFGMEGSQ